MFNKFRSDKLQNDILVTISSEMAFQTPKGMDDKGVYLNIQ